MSRHSSGTNYPPITEPSYWATKVLEPGDSETILIEAQERWNSTGIYMEPGTQYELTASGKWANGDDETSPNGVGEKRTLSTSLMVHVKHGIEKLTGAVGDWYRQLTDDQHAELVGTRRDGANPWGALIGAISDCGNPGRDGTPAEHTTFLIGESTSWPPAGEQNVQSGYLYCYMNDAWLLYGNNQGSIRLSIKRIDAQ
ncbi:hypothetical protein [Salinisphaera sp. LB1]|uniref:hypothetical protein n=1 Tax=Salinisphaera sp. LB1 TaxID=2183911 RepID=UPI0011AB7E29|nr:hypothetical protein [Salinisphaera sp. LB1]